MIAIQVDEGYAFDHLSIIEVKLDCSPSHVNEKNHGDASANIIRQIGHDLFHQIVESKDYMNLYDCNKKIFKLVDDAKEDLVTASEVDNANYERFVLKKALQEKFFGSQIKEVKVGYNLGEKTQNNS